MVRPIRFLVLAGCLLMARALPAAAPAEWNVRDFGAAGDGKTLDSPAINRAIEAAGAAGGGTVRVPAGTYLSGTIRLKSNLLLQMDAGARLLAAPAAMKAFDTDPPLPFKAYQDFGHSSWRNGLIWGENLENVTIAGPGMIDGDGNLASDPPPGGGGKGIALKLCRNVAIRDITIRLAGHFAILPTGVDNFTIDNVTVDTNRDGINLDCCRNVRVSNCIINSDDDGLCLKSSYALGYPKATENVAVTNCVISGYHRGTVLDGTCKDEGGYHLPSGSIKRIGRIKFGTESNGGFKNIVISNCVLDRCWGLALETVDGAVMENVLISNITLVQIPDAPLFIRLGNRARGPEGTTPGIARDITISNIAGTVRGNRFCSVISGIPGHRIERLTLDNINLRLAGGGTEEQAQRKLPENERGGPEPTMFGETPAYGFYFRHVKGLTLRNIRLSLDTPDARPAAIFDQVEDLFVDRFAADRSPGAARSLRFDKVKGKRIR